MSHTSSWNLRCPRMLSNSRKQTRMEAAYKFIRSSLNNYKKNHTLLNYFTLCKNKYTQKHKRNPQRKGQPVWDVCRVHLWLGPAVTGTEQCVWPPELHWAAANPCASSHLNCGGHEGWWEKWENGRALSDMGVHKGSELHLMEMECGMHNLGNTGFIYIHLINLHKTEFKLYPLSELTEWSALLWD